MRSANKALAAAAMISVAIAFGLLAAGCGKKNSSTSSKKTYKIGISTFVTHPALDAAIQGFKDALSQAGVQVTYDEQNAQTDMGVAAQIAQKFAGENLDLILTVATPNSQAMIKVDKSTPIVFTAVTDPVGSGLVTDATAPSANVTGVSDMLPVQPHLDLIKALVPNVKTIGLLYNAGESNSVFLVKAEKAAAAAMGIKTVEATASSSSEVQAAAQSLVGRVDAISVLTDNTVVSALESVVKVCGQNKIPLIAGDTDSVKRGAVAAYSFNYHDLGLQAGQMAIKILNGTSISQIPVEFAKNLTLAVNTKAAQLMGVTIPADLLSKATTTY
jgi:putative ABC transport system substrate-binding protein